MRVPKRQVRERSKMSLLDARDLVDTKRGAGVSKHTFIHLEVDIMVKAGVIPTLTFLTTVLTMIKMLVEGSTTEMPMTVVHQDKSYVQTEMEDNDSWK